MESFYKGKIIDQGKVKIDDREVVIQNSNLPAKIGDTVVIVKTLGPNSEDVYQIADSYRLNNVAPLIVLFFILIIFLSKWKGLGSILGMFISLGIIIFFIVPQILAGQNPLLISITGCFVILLTTIYLAHGFSTKTTIAVISTFLTLVFIGLLSTIFAKLTLITGLGSEDAALLKFSLPAGVDFRGLFLGGILIGALGVLDDVTTSLSAAIFEIHKVNPKQKFSELFNSGIAVGQEHISSLVNTLVLAYAGSAMPIFIWIVLNPTHYPLWLILNDGLIIEEIVRTLAGSIGLILAVPLTTFMAAFYYSAKTRRPTLVE